jgi:hypothetical protein
MTHFRRSTSVLQEQIEPSNREAVTAVGAFMIVVAIALMAVWAAIRKNKEAEVRVKFTT